MITYTIFVIDDELTIREGISMALDRTYQIETFATAEEALQAMEQGLPDLILLDIGLPGMNGIEALGRIRELSKDILVIMITAYEDTKTVIKAMKLGAYDYVVKPIIMDGLEVTIENALETVRLRKEVQILQQHYLQENMPCFIAKRFDTGRHGVHFHGGEEPRHPGAHPRGNRYRQRADRERHSLSKSEFQRALYHRKLRNYPERPYRKRAFRI